MAAQTGTTCARCEEPTVGKSKYCRAHRAEARQAFKAMLSAKSEERESRYAEYASTYEAAIEAGLKAIEGKATKTISTSPEAYLTVVPRTSGFARWLEREGKLDSDGQFVLTEARLIMVKPVAAHLKSAGFGVRVEVPVEV